MNIKILKFLLFSSLVFGIFAEGGPQHTSTEEEFETSTNSVESYNPPQTPRKQKSAKHVTFNDKDRLILIPTKKEFAEEFARAEFLNFLEKEGISLTPVVVEAAKKRKQALSSNECSIILEIAQTDSDILARLIPLDYGQLQDAQQFYRKHSKINKHIIDAVMHYKKTILMYADDTDDENLMEQNFKKIEIISNSLEVLFRKIPELQPSYEIVNAIQNRGEELTENDCEDIINLSEIISSSKLLWMAPDTLKKFKTRFNNEINAVLDIVHSYVPEAELNSADKTKIAKVLLDNGDFSIYRLIDFARSIVKRESWWAYCVMNINPDGLALFIDQNQKRT